MPRPQNKDALINLRAHPTQREIIDKAAALLKKNRTEFILDAAYREAENVLLDKRIFFADEKSFALFEAMLNEPTKDNKKLKDLLNRKAPWEK